MTDVYHLFIEEVERLTINASDSAVKVVGDLTRAVKRAQNRHDDAEEKESTR